MRIVNGSVDTSTVSVFSDARKTEAIPADPFVLRRERARVRRRREKKKPSLTSAVSRVIIRGDIRKTTTKTSYAVYKSIGTRDGGRSTL